jgi:hypothetical protein
MSTWVLPVMGAASVGAFLWMNFGQEYDKVEDFKKKLMASIPVVDKVRPDHQGPSQSCPAMDEISMMHVKGNAMGDY